MNLYSEKETMMTLFIKIAALAAIMGLSACGAPGEFAEPGEYDGPVIGLS